MTERSPAPEPSRTPTKRLWVLVQTVIIFGFIGWVAWPRSGDSGTGTGGAGAPAGGTTGGNGTASAPAAIQTAPEIPMGTAADADTLLRDVQSVDRSVAVDLRYRGTNNFTGAPLPGYEANRALLRREAAVALGQVQQLLAREGLGLLVYDGYRPVRATEAMVAWTVRTHREALIRDGYISDRSKHNLGVAIDLTLVDRRSGKPLEMGVPFDTFSPAAHTANATGAAAANRSKLVAAMQQGGFTNYDQEWWHFTYQVPAESLRRFDTPIR